MTDVFVSFNRRQGAILARLLETAQAPDNRHLPVTQRFTPHELLPESDSQDMPKLVGHGLVMVGTTVFEDCEVVGYGLTVDGYSVALHLSIEEYVPPYVKRSWAEELINLVQASIDKQQPVSAPEPEATAEPTEGAYLEIQSAALFTIVKRLVLIADMEPGRSKVWAINDLIADARDLLGHVSA